jgi:hypothetical protein
MARLGKVAVRCGIVVATLLALEGACNLGLFAYDAAFHSRRPFAEREHTRYDREIGWVAIPDGEWKDLYGKGRTLTTNARGFRGRAEVAVAAPAGKVRVVCLGDSFTLGYGVGDDDVWTSALARLDPRLEVLNLGQGGYGVDQFLLWFRRAAAELDFDLAVCAFIPEDFKRMCHDMFVVYGKPWLRLEPEGLVTENVPVPMRGYRFPWLAHNRALVNRLGAVDLVARLSGGRTRANADKTRRLDDAEAARVADAIFAELERAAEARGAALVLVHLPALDERQPDRVAQLGGWPRAACERSGARFVDLAPAFDALSKEELAELFLGEDEVDFPSAAGHYSELGNEFVARALLAELAHEIDAAAARR